MKKLKNDMDKVTIELKTKIVVLSIIPFDNEIDVRDFTEIHYHNIIGEILTVSVALNRMGNLLADIDEILSECKLDFEIFMAQMNEEKRKELEFNQEDSKGNIKVKQPTVNELDAAIIRTIEYKTKKLNLIRVQKQRDYISSLYWAVKSKDDKLNKLTEKIRPEDFEKDIIEEVINGIRLKAVKKAIK